MASRITLTRKAARLKLTSATKATYYMQVDGGDRYTKVVSVEEMVRAFESDDRARLRIRLEDSHHTVTIEDSHQMRTGYDVSF